MQEKLPLAGHLSELRRRLIICLAALAAASIASFPFSAYILKILKSPISGKIEKLAFFSPQEALLAYIKLAFTCGFLLCLPVILYQLWRFISPAVEKNIRKYTAVFVLSSAGAFTAGALFAFFIIIPAALNFLLEFGREDLTPIISVSKYIGFVTALLLGCGFVFQMPVLSFILTKAGIISPAFLRQRFRYAVILIFIIAAVITPTPDAFNMIILAAPMLFLYELSIWVSALARQRL